MGMQETSLGEDFYQMIVYLFVVIVSCIVMIVWLKRRGRNKNNR
jgi:cytochrome c biogenesis factor